MIAIYARVSTDAQVEAGLVSQIAELRIHAREKYSGEETLEFIDDGYTGADWERPKLSEMRTCLQAGRIRVVLAYDPDRLSRDAAHLLLLMKEVERGGATLDFVRGGFEQSDSGRMLLQMRGVIAEYERAQIRARTQRGRNQAAREGKWVGGWIPLGYERADGVLRVSEPQAPIIRRIFELALNGQSVRRIVTILNEDGVLPQRGSQWRTSTVHKILRNRVYLGEGFYNRRRRDKKGKREFRPESDWISIPVPPIVDTATFDRAQAQLKLNAEQLCGRNDKRAYMLRGMLRCGKCGSRISGCASHGSPYYRCGGRDRLHGHTERCYAPWLPAKEIEGAVIDAVKSVLRSGVLEEKIAERGSKIQRVDFDAEIAKAGREIEIWRRAEERAARFMVAPEHAGRQTLFEAELNRATQQRARAEERKSSLEKEQAVESAMLAQGNAVKETCRKILRSLDRMKPDKWQRVLRLLLDEVTVTGRKIELRGILPADGTLLFRTQREDIMDRIKPQGIAFIFNAEMPQRRAS